MKFRSFASIFASAALLPIAGLWITTAFGEPGARSDRRHESDARDELTLDDLNGQWTLDTWNETQAHLIFKIAKRDGQNWSSITVPIEKLSGITPEEINGSSKAITFRLQRDAATFVCEGRVARGKGAGLFEVTMDPNFAAGLRKRGLAEPSPGQLAQLALGDVGLDLVDEMRSRGARLDVEQLVRMAKHGAGLEYVRGLEAEGYAPKTVDELVEVRDHGVDPSFIRGMREAGFRGLPLGTLIEARDHGVDPKFVQGLASLGYKNLELEKLIRARDHGVSGDYARDLAQAGYPRLTLEQLIQARDHGVDGRFARRIREKLRETPPIERLIQIRDRGGLD